MDDEKKKPPSFAWLGCFALLLAVAFSMFVGGMMVARRGIGIIGGANHFSRSPVGVWKGTFNGNVMEIRADGTGALLRDGRVEYFEWRLDGNDFGIYQFSKPNSVSAWINRILRGSGLQGELAHDNFFLVEVTSEKLTLALDDEPHPESGWKLGDHIEYEAVTE